MIRFHRIFELVTDIDRQRFAEAATLFCAAFPDEAQGIQRIGEYLRNRPQLTFDPILLVSTDARRRTTGLAFVYYFADLRYGYLEYIASDLNRSARGIGAALYEAMRELLATRGARGLFLDVPPADPSKLKDPSRLPVNRRRLRFYARYAIHEVRGTEWDVTPNPRNEDYLTTLLYDPLGQRPRLERADARRVVRRILMEEFGYETEAPFVVRSRLRRFRQQSGQTALPWRRPFTPGPLAKRAAWPGGSCATTPT
jgi:GNAT superfamily N-acetyltransferase